MAVDINIVYSRVLLLANKDQRGYITPDEFNSFANQAQLEIFEGYFQKKAQAMAAGADNDSDYVDPVQNIEEKLTFFDETNDSVDVDETTRRLLYSDIAPTDQEFYRLGVVIVNGREATEIGHREATYVNLSPLTAPTTTQPIYTRHSDGLVIYPRAVFTGSVLTSGVGSASIVYLRKPSTVNWGYRFPTAQEVIDLGLRADEPFYLAPGSVGTPENGVTAQFELHPSEEHELVYKILTLSGVAIKAADLAQFGAGKDGQLQQTEA